ncbi:MAG: formylglycine-generating enzyme family protein [Nitrospinota bacterium]
MSNIELPVLHPLVGGAPPEWASAWGQDRFGVWVEFVFDGVVQRMRWIRPGRFMMGSPETEKGRFGNEEEHEVVLTSGYWLADTPCTQELWAAVMGENPARFKGKSLPVETVNWTDARNFLDRINSKVSGLNLRLPSEAEWEYACRAGTATAFSFGDSISKKKANFSGQQTLPVKNFKSNSWGLYDMHGNVWEWCEDWYADYEKGPVFNPLGPAKGSYRVFRGGGWSVNARRVRSACRCNLEPESRYYFLGFRFARGQE